MTQDSYNNYVANVAIRIGELGNSLVDDFEKDKCNLERKAMNLRILSAYIDILSCWDLPEEDVDGVIENNNCLSIEEMKSITTHINKLTGDNYCVDYYKKFGEQKKNK